MVAIVASMLVDDERVGHASQEFEDRGVHGEQ
jgi:hypothetical protein